MNYQVKNTINGEVEYFETMQDALDFIESELNFYNVHEKLDPYTSDDFFLSPVNND